MASFQKLEQIAYETHITHFEDKGESFNLTLYKNIHKYKSQYLNIHLKTTKL